LAKTMSEKIIGEHAGRSVSAGETVIATVDLCFTHDASGPLLISQLKELGLNVANPRNAVFFKTMQFQHQGGRMPTTKSSSENMLGKLERISQKQGTESATS